MEERYQNQRVVGTPTPGTREPWARRSPWQGRSDAPGGMGGARARQACAQNCGGTPAFGVAFSRKDAPPGTVSVRQEQECVRAPRRMTAPDAESVSY